MPLIRHAAIALTLFAVLMLLTFSAPADVARSAQDGIKPVQAAAAVQARQPLAKGPRPVRPAYEHMLVVKFRDDLLARAIEGQIVSLARAQINIAADVAANHGATFTQLIQLSPERIRFLEDRAQQARGVAQPDLAGIMRVDAPPDRLQAIADALHASELVEWVQFDEVNPPPPVMDTPCIDIAPVTPSYVSLQTYRGPNPGLNMNAFWAMGNARGAGIKVADCEYWYNGDHEDLCNIIPEPGQTPHPNVISNNWHEHGTAVMGEMVGGDNAYGVTGLVPDAQGYFFPEWTVQGGSRRVTAIANAIATVNAGDVVLLEMQTTGAGGGYGPAELNAAVWTVVKNGVDAGVIVVGAAGNGNQNLDSSAYNTYMSWGDSGAIIVGAGSANTSHNKLSFSTYGSRVNVQGWGQSVFTTGYGTFAEIGGDFNQRYTSSFNGTSSASPFIAAAAVSLQSFAVANIGRRLTPAEMRDVLTSTGIPQGSGGHIGPFPDMVAAGNAVLGMGLPNNACDNAIAANVGATPFSTLGAGTNGPDEPGLCDLFGDSHLEHDIWFSHVATCTGSLTIDLCDSTYHSKVAVYAACPTKSGQVLACNTGGCFTRAKLTMPVTQGQSLIIRIGGHFGTSGQGTMILTCDEVTCPADLNRSGEVDIQDLLALLATWGPCPQPCATDLSGDGQVDVSDLLMLLGAWGACP